MVTAIWTLSHNGVIDDDGMTSHEIRMCITKDLLAAMKGVKEVKVEAM